MELHHYFTIFRRWGWILLLCVLEGTGVTYYFSSRQPNVYEARARYLVGPALNQVDVTRTEYQASEAAGQTYAELATSRPVLDSVIDTLQLNTTADTLAGRVTANWIGTTRILSIRVRASDPERAADIANAVGEALIERGPGGSLAEQAARREEAEAQLTQLQQRVRTHQAEIDRLTNQIQQTTDQLEQRALIIRLEQEQAQAAATQEQLDQQTAIAQNTSTNQIGLIEAAIANSNPVAPRVLTNVLAALLAGIVLGLVLMFLFEYFLDAVYTPEDLQKATGLPYLAGIVRHRRLRRKSSRLIVQAHPMSPTAESYRVLRVNLHRTAGNQQLSSLLITSSSPGDGKSSISANLAVTFAKAGKRVILIDADLRRPQLATLFGLFNNSDNRNVPDPDYGLSNLLSNGASILEPIAIPSVPGLSLLPAGSPTPNSSEILASRRMQQLLQAYEASADLVILDSPPLPYADALTLASQVDGVVLVASSGKTRRRHLTDAVESLRLAGAHLVGTVFNRVKAKSTYAYYAGDMAGRKDQVFGGQPTAPSERRHVMGASAQGADGEEQAWAGMDEDRQLMRTTQVLPEMSELSFPGNQQGQTRPRRK